MVRKAKKNYFNNLSVINISDNKQFWKTVKLFFFNNDSGIKGITLIEDDNVVSKDKEVAETFMSYFETLVENIGINSKFMSKSSIQYGGIKTFLPPGIYIYIYCIYICYIYICYIYVIYIYRYIYRYIYI